MNKLILFFTCLIGLGTADAMAQQQGGALLRLEHASHNFGDVSRKGGDLVKEFRFTNEGDAPLVVMRVITSCSCLKAAYPKQPVLPGQHGVISITYEPHKSDPGIFNKVIRILSNSAGGEEVISVQGNSIDPELSRGERRLLRERAKVTETKIKSKAKNE